MKARFFLAAAVGSACVFLSSAIASADPKHRVIISKVEASFRDHRMAGLRVTFHNGLILEGNDQLRRVSASLPDGSKWQIDDVLMYASDDAVHLNRSRNGFALQQTIARTIDRTDHFLGAHVGWLYQKARFSDEVEMYEKRSVNGANPLGGSVGSGQVEELADGTIQAQSGEIITPIIPKAWILSAAPHAHPAPRPLKIKDAENKSLDELRKAADGK